MLWNSIFEFFVIHIFGGILMVGDSPVYYRAAVGGLYNPTSNAFFKTSTSDISILTYDIFHNGTQFHLCLGNYLSLIATIITIVTIVVLCNLFVYKIVKLIGGLITR